MALGCAGMKQVRVGSAVPSGCKRVPCSAKRQTVARAVAAPPAAGAAFKDPSPRDAPLPSLFPSPPKVSENDPKLKVVVIGAGLSGLSTAVELLDKGYQVEIYDQRPHIGGKVASWIDKDGNHIEMGLHVFFGCYFNLFRLMAKAGVMENLLLKDHAHTFINEGGDVRLLDFRAEVAGLKLGAPFHGLKAFFTTPQLSNEDKLTNAVALGTSPIVRAVIDPEGGMKDVRKLDGISFQEWFTSNGGSQNSIDRMWDPIAYALGFLDCKDISARCMLSIFHFFATKTDASVLRMLSGSPNERLLKPIVEYIERKGGKIHMRTGCQEVMYDEGPDGKPFVTSLRMKSAGKQSFIKADVYVAALDCGGAKRMIPAPWRKYPIFDNIYQLDGVPVITVQLRYDGWVTELKDQKKATNLKDVAGIDNLLYSSDVDFSCFADLAVVSPQDYRKEGVGSLMQVVITPCQHYMPLSNEAIAEQMDVQVKKLFPSSKNLKYTWHSVVKIQESLYREAPGLDKFRPDQQTPVPNFYMAGSYTAQDYIDSMEGATLSGRQAAYKILTNARKIAAVNALRAEGAGATSTSAVAEAPAKAAATETAAPKAAAATETAAPKAAAASETAAPKAAAATETAAPKAAAATETAAPKAAAATESAAPKAAAATETAAPKAATPEPASKAAAAPKAAATETVPDVSEVTVVPDTGAPVAATSKGFGVQPEAVVAAIKADKKATV